MKIQVFQGKFDKTCTVSSNLTENQVKMPVIRDVIQYAEPRMISTLIVSGVTSPYDLKNKPTRIGTIPSDKLIGDNAYRYQIQGRIQKPSEIVAQVGQSLPDGTFQLTMRDNLLYPGMVAVFYTGLQARVMSGPTGAAGNYLYTFQTIDGTVFNYAAHVAPQNGTKTCFGSYTAYGERSLRGYSRSFYPDMYINHMTIQRKTLGMSGSALTDVLWYAFNGTKGWFFKKEREARIQFMMEDEFHKWFTQSTMKDANGNLLAQSRLTDPETGEPIVIGDGIIPQIAGQNDMYGSGINGFPTIDDFKDMMTQLEKRCNSYSGKRWVVVTGTDGYVHAQEVLRDYWFTSLGGRTPNGNNQNVTVGSNFDTFNFAGNTVTFVKHTLFDDEQRFPQRGSDGKILQSGMYVFLDMADYDGKPNIEILSKGAYGINRSMVSGYVNGLTGYAKDIQNGIDALEFNMLKEDMIVVYNTASCGIIYKSLV